MIADPASNAGLLVDTNLLVLYVVGTVSQRRIETFKRTSQYTRPDYELLVRVFGYFQALYTVPHVLAEVSNLTDLSGSDRSAARAILKNVVTLLTEVEMPSVRAAEDPYYPRLGLTDAAIGSAARAHRCAVLTDDLDLYVQLSRDGLPVWNFTHIRAQALNL